jgi:hypothetical protein
MQTVKELRDNYKAINKANAGVGFFDRQVKLSQTDPSSFDNMLQYAELEGRRLAQEMLNIVSDSSHPEHSKTCKLYNDKFDCSPDLIFKQFINIETKAHAEKRIELIKKIHIDAKVKTKEFLASVKNYESETHIENVKLFKEKFNVSPDRVENYFLDLLYKQYGQKRVETRDIAYEKSLLEGVSAGNEFEKSTVDSLTDLFTEKFSAVGYQNDSEVYELFKKESLDIPGKPTFKPKN